ncbi:MAG TPA: protoporphyrinogen oxidase [Polyangiaceae bacterium]|nr:protoporphyrinogen oxidase [Polyangiaceae bacterium]
MESLARRMADGTPRRVAVIGGGVTGLTAAYEVHRQRPDVELRLFEARAELGGNIRTERRDGFVIDAGPDSFVITKPDALALCRELGLEPELCATEDQARHVFVAHDGALTLMPGGMALAVPTRLGPLLETPLLSLRGKLRLLLEPFVPRKRAHGDESMLAFLERRLGSEGAVQLAGPLLSGIYAGDLAELSIESTFPQLVELEQSYGSLIRGFLALELTRGGRVDARPGIAAVVRWLRRSGAAQAPSPFRSMKSGMSTLIDALAAQLPAGAVRRGVAVTAIERLAGGAYRVVARDESFVADAVVLATPAHVAAKLLPDAEAARELARIPYVSTATVFFALDTAQVKSNLHGFGFIVPPGEANILAGTWVSSKWRGRAPEGAALVRAFVGGARDPQRIGSSTDEELVAFSKRELERLMGPLGTPRWSRVYRYENASPQPRVGHGALLERVRARCAAALPGLYLAGAAYDGVGIPDCIRQARGAATAAVKPFDEQIARRAAS